MHIVCNGMYGHIVLLGSLFCLWGQGVVLWVIPTAPKIAKVPV